MSGCQLFEGYGLKTRLKSPVYKCPYRNRPWWPSGLEHVSNSSRHSVADPVSNPHRDYSIDRSESEMACHYSNSRAPGDMCRLQYQTEHRRYQARPMCLSIAIIPILQWRRIDGALVV